MAEANKSKRDPQLAPLRVSSRRLHLCLYLPSYLSIHKYLYLYFHLLPREDLRGSDLRSKDIKKCYMDVFVFIFVLLFVFVFVLI